MDRSTEKEVQYSVTEARLLLQGYREILPINDKQTNSWSCLRLDERYLERQEPPRRAFEGAAKGWSPKSLLDIDGKRHVYQVVQETREELPTNRSQT